MDFFQAQDNAVKKTKQLVFYYLVAVILIIIGVYFAIVAGFMTYAELTRPEGAPTRVFEVPLWDPFRFVATAVGVILWVGIGSFFRTLSLRSGGAAVAKSLGADKVDRSTKNRQRKQLLNVVEEMSIASGVPIPEVYVLNGETSINAFAAGWNTDDAVIAVSAGALEKLSRDELQGVVAHEYSHVLHGDCRLNIRLMGILFGIMMLSVVGRLMGAALRGGGRGIIFIPRGGGGGGGSKGGGKGKGGAIVLAVIVVIILITIIGYIGTFFARLIQAAISRQREFLADAAAVQFTRNPEGIAGALKRIAIDADLAVLNTPKASEAAHMFFADGLKRSFSSALATHPPLNVRIQSIEPGWDGSFESVKPLPKAAPPIQPKPAAKAAFPGGGDFIQGMTILGAIGTMSQGNLQTAKDITATIPQGLDESMRDPEGARLVILALLIAHDPEDDVAQWKLIEESMSAEDAQSVRESEALIRKLPRAAMLGVLELASTTLAQSMKEGHEAFYALVEKLIHADDQVSLYEFCVRRIVRERLARGSTQASEEAKIEYMQLQPVVAKAVSNLLSVIVRETSGATNPAEFLESALRELYLLRGKVSYLDNQESGVAQLDESIDVLKKSAYAIRAQTLRAIVASIEADGQLSPEEAEILRMFSLSLNCPVPPITFKPAE